MRMSKVEALVAILLLVAFVLMLGLMAEPSRADDGAETDPYEVTPVSDGPAMLWEGWNLLSDNPQPVAAWFAKYPCATIMVGAVWVEDSQGSRYEWVMAYPDPLVPGANDFDTTPEAFWVYCRA